MKKITLLFSIYLYCILGFAQQFKIDTTFNPGDTIPYFPTPFTIGGSIMIPASNGGIYVVATRNIFNGTLNIYRTTPDGKFDETFDAGTGPAAPIYGYINNTFNAVVCNPDNSVFVGGEFPTFNGKNKAALVKLSPNGLVDMNYNKNQTGLYSSYGAKVFAMCKDNDNLVVAGIFESYNDTTVLDLIRLKPNGSLDLDFANNAKQAISPYKMISRVYRLSNGKFLVAYYDYPDTYPSLLRLNSDGTLDNTFNFNTTYFAKGYIKAILELPDGRCLIGGRFLKQQTDLNSQSLFCISANGNITADLMSGDGVRGVLYQYSSNYSYNDVNSILRKSDGKIIVTGTFDGYDNYPSRNALMFNSDLTLNQTFFSKLENVFSSFIDSNDDIIINKYSSYDHYQQYFAANESICKLNLDGTVNPDYNRMSGSNRPILNAINIGEYIYAIGHMNSYNNTVVKGGVIKLNKEDGLPVENYPTAPNEFRGYTTKIIQNGTSNKFVIQGEYHTKTQSKINLCLMNEQGLERVLLSSEDLLNGDLLDFCIQKNGKIIIVGSFTRVKGIDASYIARLNPDGSVDQTFNYNISPNNFFQNVKAFGTDELLVLGLFTKIDNINKNNVAKLSPNGVLINNYNLDINYSTNISSIIDTTHNDIYFYGNLYSINNTSVGAVSKITSTGILSSGFNHSSITFDGNLFNASFNYSNNTLTLFKIHNVAPNHYSFNIINVSASSGELLSNSLLANANYTKPSFILPINLDTIIVGGEFSSFDFTNRKFILRIVNDPNAVIDDGDDDDDDDGGTDTGGGVTTGIQSNNMNAHINLYPNPSSGVFVVKTQYINSNYYIYNSLGKIVQYGIIENDQTHLTINEKGIYYIQITNSHGSSNDKIIIE